MEFRVLGPIELWSAGQQCDLGSTRLRCVLAILALTPRTLVPTDVLIDRVWDTDPPPKAREGLSVYITRLRASLRQAIGESVRLTGHDSGYELHVDPDVIDLHQFRRLRREADALTADGDAERAAALLREADRLWRGQAFAGIRGKLEYERLETERFLRRHGIVNYVRNPFFPVNTLRTMRGAAAAELDGTLARYVAAVFHHMWE